MNTRSLSTLWQSSPAPNRWQRPAAFLFFRIISILLIAFLALILPQLGPNRFLLAGILFFFTVPLVILMEVRFPVATNGWTEPLHDLLLVVVLVHLVPQVWFAALVIGLMVALSPSIGSNPQGYKFYALLGLILITGMSFAAIVHDVHNWVLPIVAIVAIYPSLLYYSYWLTSRANDLRRRSEALTNLNLLAGGIAHDFNNVLTGITGHSELALLDLPADHPARQPVQKALEGAKRASLLAGQLLSFSGKGVSKQTDLDLAEEVRLAVALIRPIIPKGIDVELLGLSPDPASQGNQDSKEQHSLPFIHGDQTQIHQVIMNVVLNAAEAISEFPATITIQLSRDSGHASKQNLRSDDSLRLDISDPGAGIAPEMLPRLFDPFFTSKTKGHGLGLAVTQRIMLAHGGDIQISSIPGQGTRVRLIFPCSDSSAHRPQEEDGDIAQPRNPGETILIIDDEEPIRQVTQQFLEKLGYAPLGAENGALGLQLLKKHSNVIQGVILDLKMPGMDGWQVLDHIKTEQPQLPVIICSGYNPEGDNRIDNYSNVATLAKPYRLADLKDALAQLAQLANESIE